MRLHRLSGRKVCERVKQKGFLWKGKHFHVRIMKGLPRNLPENSPEGLYVGVVTSTKLHKSAVVRNRMRRRCREALRIAVQKHDKLPSAQLLMLPRSTSLFGPFGEIHADAEHLLSSLSRG